MRFRRRGSSRIRGKRSVSWIAGFSGMDDANGTPERVFAFAGPVAGTVTTWGVAVELVGSNDLTFSGGEDAVVSRIRGRLFFYAGRRNAGAGFAVASFPLRVAIYQHEVLPALTFNEAFTRSTDLGQDRILHLQDTIVTGDTYGAGQGFDWDQPHRIDIDVKAKRKVQNDNTIVLAFQTVFPGGTTAADMKVAGSLRTLLMRPR